MLVLRERNSGVAIRLFEEQDFFSTFWKPFRQGSKCILGKQNAMQFTPSGFALKTGIIKENKLYSVDAQEKKN